MKICAYGSIKNGLRSLPISECEKATSHPPTPDDKMEGQPAQALSHKERDDNYFAVVAMLTPRWRVVLCKNGTQFILQRHFAETAHSGAWRANSFHASRDSLIKACVTLGLVSDIKIEQLLASLPATARECAISVTPK
jgi:hypothetical protein